MVNYDVRNDTRGVEAVADDNEGSANPASYVDEFALSRGGHCLYYTTLRLRYANLRFKTSHSTPPCALVSLTEILGLQSLYGTSERF